jgi:hypothetical protein
VIRWFCRAWSGVAEIEPIPRLTITPQRAGCCYFCQLGHERASSRDNAYCVLRAITRHRQRNVSDTGDGQPVRSLASCRYQDSALKPLWNIWCQRGSRLVTEVTRCRRSARFPPRRDAAPVDPSAATRTGSSRRLGRCDWVNRSLFLHEPASRQNLQGSSPIGDLLMLAHSVFCPSISGEHLSGCGGSRLKKAEVIAQLAALRVDAHLRHRRRSQSR